MQKRGRLAAVLLAGRDGAGATGDAFQAVGDSQRIEECVSTLSGADVDQFIVILGEPAGTLAFPIGAESTTVKRYKEWERGYRAAVAAGVRAIAPDVAGVLVATCDLAPESAKGLNRMVRRFQRGEAGIYACHDGERVHLPALFDRRHRNALLGMQETTHLLDLVTAHPDDVEYVDILTPTPQP